MKLSPPPTVFSRLHIVPNTNLAALKKRKKTSVRRRHERLAFPTTTDCCYTRHGTNHLPFSINRAGRARAPFSFNYVYNFLSALSASSQPQRRGGYCSTLHSSNTRKKTPPPRLQQQTTIRQTRTTSFAHRAHGAPRNDLDQDHQAGMLRLPLLPVLAGPSTAATSVFSAAQDGRERQHEGAWKIAKHTKCLHQS